MNNLIETIEHFLSYSDDKLEELADKNYQLRQIIVEKEKIESREK